MSEILFENQSQNKMRTFYQAYISVGPFSIQNIDCPDYGNRKNNFHWQLVENVKYALFIEFNEKKMEGKSHKQLWKVYQAMSKHIKSRNYRQCKLYHQRMLEQHETLKKILTFLKEDHPQFEQLMERERQTIRSYDIGAGVEKLSTGDLVETDAAYYLGLESRGSETLIRTEKNKQQSLRECQQVFNSWANKLKNLILPPICLEKA